MPQQFFNFSLNQFTLYQLKGSNVLNQIILNELKRNNACIISVMSTVLKNISTLKTNQLCSINKADKLIIGYREKENATEIK